MESPDYSAGDEEDSDGKFFTEEFKNQYLEIV